MTALLSKSERHYNYVEFLGSSRQDGTRHINKKYFNFQQYISEGIFNRARKCFHLSTILGTLENAKKCNNFTLILQIGQDTSIKIEQFPIIVLIPG